MESLAEEARSAAVKHPVLKTVVHWDSISALIVGTATGVAWALNGYEAELVWIVPGIALSVLLGTMAWNQWNQLKSALRGTDYGELLRLADPNEDDIKRPYSVVTYVSFAAAVWTTLTGFLLDLLSQTWESFFIGVGVFLLAWTCLGAVSLKMISDRNDRNVARLEALREETAAAQREMRRRQTSRGADSGTT